jgi:hypothetical protein
MILQMLGGRAAKLGADFATLQGRLIALTESSERAAIIKEMRAILDELEQLIRLAEAEENPDSSS